MPLIEIPDEPAAWQFRGHRIAGPVSTAFDHTGRQRPRWLEAELYARDDGGYVMSQANFSLVWHLPSGGGHVRKPARVPSGELPGNAVYCGTLPPRPGREACPPEPDSVLLDPFGTGGAVVHDAAPLEVITELPQRKVFRCRDFTDLIRRISTARHGDGGMSFTLSAPMQELIRQAAESDPAFEGLAVVEL
jgi:hypothetical protein